ncbi:Biotin carboxylase C-terminal domain-containing protein [Reichenbachiella agariperforans]|uniref:Biotin carboxylase C-terminal domain-containing protein n=1 Tax=Reichenbachiella agariperforans TaxID=156994 RepID=A0A1M6SYU3_REIAG|nr:acetyl-CoA carboxylase biotin carboxylase subunit [Reichenbachiella agariperforans]SHK49837.1 Biotin carboxylase C-terminal domain-containing protein [Reichenbachiella agariperforans]
MMKFKKILVANRGEIALRIMRTVREMNIATVAVYSKVDRGSPHVSFADEAVCIGDAVASDSYLNIDKVIQVCKDLHVDAVHPGYGFLSENPLFARALSDHGIVLIGPSAKSMELMGDKLTSKNLMAEHQVPMVPGVNKAVRDVEEAKRIASEVSYPVMIKASAGGGGKGMRIIENEAELESMMARAVSEAASAFGNDAVFIEKYVTNPRHIEIQVLADQHGHTVHLFERECSVQRRHQKVIEEAPSSVLTEAKRQEMGAAAVRAAEACDYVGAGTVEFMVDGDLNFFFLEMNTRLQVEHCVTEEITGLDLVKEQIKIAQGESLSFGQDDLHINGHALEIRVYAEDPTNGFLPSTGTLSLYQRPQGVGVRVDDGFEQGMKIDTHYDPMIGKLICKGKDRAEAIERMSRAIDEFRIGGVETTLQFCKFAINHEAFKSGNFDTGFVSKYFDPALLNPIDENTQEVAAIMAVHVLDQAKSTQLPINQKSSAWQSRRS